MSTTLEPALVRLEGLHDYTRVLAGLRLTLGAAYLQLREFDKALAAFDRARAEGGDVASIDAYRVQAQLEAGRPAEALEIARAARVRFPDDLRLLGLEADAWLKAGDRTRAVALHEGAIERHGDDPEAHVAFAGLLLEARDFAARRARARGRWPRASPAPSPFPSSSAPFSRSSSATMRRSALFAARSPSTPGTDRRSTTSDTCSPIAGSGSTKP